MPGPVVVPLGKLPYSTAADSPVNRWTSPAARDMLSSRAATADGTAAANDDDVEAAAATPKLPLGGGEQSYGFYIAQVNLGTPGQPVSLLMDTGSSDLAVNLASCRRAFLDGSQELCPETFSNATQTGGACQTRESFDPTKSSTVVEVPCATAGLRCYNEDPVTGTCASATEPCIIHDCYGDNTGFDARVHNDTLQLASLEGTMITFGGIYVDYLNFTSASYSGIFGLAYQTLSYGEVPAMTATLEANGLDDTFSLCLGGGPSNPPADGTTSGSGYMLLGDSSQSSARPSSTTTSGFQGFTDILDPSYYNVNLLSIAGDLGTQGGVLENIAVNSTVEPGVAQGTIVDSGTTELILKYRTWVGFWNSLIEAGVVLDSTCLTLPGEGYCCEFDRSASQINVDFSFENSDGSGNPVVVSKPLSQMVISCVDSADSYVYYPMVGTGMGINILGEAFMKDSLVEFDRANGRVGFSTGMDCAGKVAAATLGWALGVTAAVVVIVAISVWLGVRRARRARTQVVRMSSSGQAPLVRTTVTTTS